MVPLSPTYSIILPTAEKVHQSITEATLENLQMVRFKPQSLLVINKPQRDISNTLLTVSE